MNTRNLFFPVCLGTGMFFLNYFLGNSKAFAVSFKPFVYEFSLEAILEEDLALEADFKGMPLGDLESLKSPIKINNLLVVNEPIKLPLQVAQPKDPLLLSSLITSLQELEFNGRISNSQISNSEENTVLILSQTDLGNIYQNVYDFDTELTNDFRENPRNIPQNRINNQETPRFFKQEILSYSYLTPKSNKNSPANLNRNTSRLGISNSLSQNYSRNYSYTTYSSSSYYTGSQVPISNNISSSNTASPIRKISTVQYNISRPSPNKTKQQIELEKKLAKQREQLRKKAQKLKERLAKEREQRAKQRAKERQKRLKEQQKRFQRIAKQQAKSRNRNR